MKQLSGARKYSCVGGCVFAAIALIASSCKQRESAAKGSVPDPVAIQIGKREVKLSELQSEMDMLRNKRNPMAADLDTFLDSYVERQIALQKALELRLDEDSELRRQWENLLIGRVRQTEVEAKLQEVAVTDEEIREYYQRNLNAYSRAAQLNLALLYLSVPANADESTRAAIRKRMEEARELAKTLPENTRGFGAHAMTYSEEATSRFKGGDIGWLEAGASAYRWPQEVIKAGFALTANGDLSDVIQTADGYYLLKKLDSREAVVRSLDGRMRATLMDALLKEKRATIQTQIKESWQKSSNVTIHKEVVKNLNFQVTPIKSADYETIPAKP